jgi:predicted MFS family arabinose efflux permease
MLGLIGIAMSDMASAWLMTSLDADPRAVSWVQVAANLPMFLFTLPAGALIDSFNPRRFLLVVQAAIAAVTLGFALMISLRVVGAYSLLAMTFALSAAWTAAAPAWLAILPALVPKTDLDSATAINGAGYNVSRAVGPAVGGVAIALFGVASPFWIFGAVNVATILALLRWRNPVPASPMPAEPLASALRVGLRHGANNSHLIATIARTLAIFPFASAYWALLPLLARDRMGGGPQTFGMLLGALGAGALAGALGLNGLKAWLGPDRLALWGALATAAALALFGVVRDPRQGVALCVVAGVAWIVVMATLYVSAQVALPDWVRGRGLSLFLTVIFGAMTLGGVVWGQVAEWTGMPAALFIAAAGALLGAPLSARFRLQTGADLDLSPSRHWRLPAGGRDVADAEGPILVVREYCVDAPNRAAFLKAIGEIGHERKRDGAYAWGVFEDPVERTRLWETFLIESWLEFRLFCERVTNADRLVEERARRLLAAPVKTKVMTPPK